MNVLFLLGQRASRLRVQAALVRLAGSRGGSHAFKVGKVFLLSRMFTSVAVPNRASEKQIYFEPVLEKFNSRNPTLVASLRDFLVGLVNMIRTLFRAMQLSVIFIPLLSIAPLAAWSEKYQTWWFQVLVRTLEISGPVCIKLGQWASTRRDLFPLRLCQELSKLQRESTPHSWEETEKVLIENYGSDYSHLFLDFSRQPVGSGCCAQVYKATLRHGAIRDVAVKVLHPSIELMFNRDLRVMAAFVGVINWCFPSLKYLSLQESLDEFSSLMRGQVNLSDETENLKRFVRLYDSSDGIVFPKPVERLCSKNIIVESFEAGQHIGDFIESPSFKYQLQMRKEIAEIGVQLLLKMVFQDNLVHGDLHPGNLLVRPDMSGRGEHKLVVLDPGIVSSLSAKDLRNLRAVFTAVVRGEGTAVGKLFLEHSVHRCPNPEAFVDEMSQIVLEARSQQLSLSKLNVSDLLTKVFSTLCTHRVKLEANYASVILAIMVLEGLGRTLDPDLDIILKAVPYLIRR